MTAIIATAIIIFIALMILMGPVLTGLIMATAIIVFDQLKRGRAGTSSDVQPNPGKKTDIH